MDVNLKLQKAIGRLGKTRVAKSLGKSSKTIERWRQSGIPNDTVLQRGLEEILSQELLFPIDNPVEKDFTFIDLFAGIGGTRLGFEKAGGGCVFTSEWDKFARQTYEANFLDHNTIHGDIKELTGEAVSDTELDEAIPDHDVLVGGFPCQPFSLAGVSKKNSLGVAHGFACKTQGTLFFDIARIIAVKRPAAFMLENVKNLERHNKGNTFKVILETLRDELGYKIDYKVIDAKRFVPQHRERIFIIGFREQTDFSFEDVELPSLSEGPVLETILHPEDGSETAEPPYTEGSNAAVAKKFHLTNHLWTYLKNYKKKHQAAGNGFGFSKVEKHETARTLSARYHKDGSEILISRGGRKNPRKLTPRECARLMGFPDSYKIPVSNTQAYRQFGNSVVVPCVAAIAAAMKPHIMQVKNGGVGRKKKTA
jgi:DNA (cytosine-5)-methyltransferase 1